MTIEIDTDEIVTELTEDSGFTSWIDERIDERSPGEYELPYDVTRDSQLDLYVTKDDLAEQVREVLSNGAAASQDIETTGEQITGLLGTLPVDSVSRCRLGRAFEQAVVRVLKNVLRGEHLVTEDLGEESSRVMDVHLAAAVKRSLDQLAAPEHEDVATPEWVPPLGTQVTCDAATDLPHARDEECRNPVPVERAQAAPELPRLRITIDVSTSLSQDVIARTAHDLAVGWVGVAGNPVVQVQPAATVGE